MQRVRKFVDSHIVLTIQGLLVLTHIDGEEGEIFDLPLFYLDNVHKYCQAQLQLQLQLQLKLRLALFSISPATPVKVYF